jgi:hypothetical protein
MTTFIDGAPGRGGFCETWATRQQSTLKPATKRASVIAAFIPYKIQFVLELPSDCVRIGIRFRPGWFGRGGFGSWRR